MVTFIFSIKLTFVSDFEPLCQIQTKRLGAICENVEGDLERNQEREKTKKDGGENLRTFPLHVGDEPLKESGRLNLKRNPLQIQFCVLFFPM